MPHADDVTARIVTAHISTAAPEHRPSQRSVLVAQMRACGISTASFLSFKQSDMESLGILATQQIFPECLTAVLGLLESPASVALCYWPFLTGAFGKVKITHCTNIRSCRSSLWRRHSLNRPLLDRREGFANTPRPLEGTDYGSGQATGLPMPYAPLPPPLTEFAHHTSVHQELSSNLFMLAL